MMKEKNLFKTFSLLAIFSIAMGFMESAIVVYLRKIYYPHGFSFPLTPIDPNIGVTEIMREAATLIMLIAIGIAAGRTKLQRLAFFIFCFGTWDIFYYVFLKMLLNWPANIFDWDILFLIPVPWVGPVVAPCLLSMTMILFAVILTALERKVPQLKVKTSDWLMMSAGSIIIIFSFVLEYIRSAFSADHGSKNQYLLSSMNNYVPEHYNWWIFFTGEIILLVTLLWILKRNITLKNSVINNESAENATNFI
jgi:hypothetical protein